MAMALRRECRAMEALLKQCLAMGVSGASEAAMIQKCLMSSRSTMLEIVGLPKRPGRVPAQQIKQIQEAVGEEIEITQAVCQVE